MPNVPNIQTMRKLILSAIALTSLVLFGAGCGKTADNKQGMASSLITSIKDAFNHSATLRCDYLDENGNSTIAYIKDRKIFMEEDVKNPDQSTQNGQKIDTVKGLILDDKMYLWSGTSDKGLIVDFKKPSAGNIPKMGDKEIHSTDDVIGKLEEKKERCKTATVDDSQFELPKDIQFMNF